MSEVDEIKERVERIFGPEAAEKITAFLEELMGRVEEKPPDLSVSVSEGVQTVDRMGG